VVVNQYQWKNKSRVPWYFFIQFWTILANIYKYQLLVVSFGGYWSFWPSVLGRLFRKPVYIILHGTDCASIPELQYGSLRHPILKWFCKVSYQNASCLLPVSDSLVYHQNSYYKDNGDFIQGFKHFFPKLETPVRVIYNGLDTDFWKDNVSIEKEENSFISVFSASQFILKGGDLIVKIASKFPNCNFYLAGLEKPVDLKDVPPNVHFLGRLDAEELRYYYNRSQFHFQLSIIEGFGCALCEAILCGCVPIVSNVNHLPEIVAENGFILEKRDTGLLEELIQNILDDKEKLPMKREGGMKRIRDNYSLENRKKILLELFSESI